MLNEALEWHEGTHDTLILLAHATGFCKETWRPVVADLRARGVTATALAWDIRGHGRAPGLDLPASWWKLGEDLVGLLRRLGDPGTVPQRRIGVGHSMGGTVLVLAELLRPGSFHHLILIEPVLLPPPFVRTPDLSLAQGAARRRPAFDSFEELVDHYLAKPLFRRWHPQAFDAYVHHGFQFTPEGAFLRCDRAVEAELFSTGAECGAYAQLHRLGVPVRLIITDHPGELEASLAHLPGAIPDVKTSYLVGENHLVPMERPDLIAAEIADALGGS